MGMKIDHLLHNWLLLEWRYFKGDWDQRARLHKGENWEGIMDSTIEEVTGRNSPGGGE